MCLWKPLSTNEHSLGHNSQSPVFVFPCMHALACPTLCHPMDCNPLGSSVHGIILARILEWVAIPYSRGFSRPRDRTYISWGSCLDRQILYHWATWEVPSFPYSHPKTFSELLVRWWFCGFVSASVLNLGYLDDLAWLGRIISWKHWYDSGGTEGRMPKSSG